MPAMDHLRYISYTIIYYLSELGVSDTNQSVYFNSYLLSIDLRTRTTIANYHYVVTIIRL